MDSLKTTISKTILFYALIFLALACEQKPSENTDTNSSLPALPTADANNGGLTLPDNFGTVVVADSTGRARHIAVNDQGDIFIKMRRLKEEKGILTISDTTGNGKMDTFSGFDLYTGTGIHIYNNYLYASSDSSVYRYPLENGAVPAEAEPEVIVSGFPIQRSHASKTLAFDNAGNIYVNVGGPSNACMEESRTPGSPGMDPCPQLEYQAGIWRFDANKPGQTQKEDGYRYATGIRNAVALEWNDKENSLYALQHGRDQLNNLFTDLYTDEQSAELPSEEFLQINEGDDFGWPYCYYDHFKNQKILAPEYGGDGEKTGRCEDIKAPIMAFPAHWAPNDLLFYTGDLFPEKYKNGAFIAFHGSWNRGPFAQKGYSVVFVPFKDGKPSGDWEIFATGFKGKDEIMSPSEAAHRPVGLAQGPDGSLYISDSVKGKIWRVMYYDNVTTASL